MSPPSDEYIRNILQAAQGLQPPTQAPQVDPIAELQAENRRLKAEAEKSKADAESASRRAATRHQFMKVANRRAEVAENALADVQTESSGLLKRYADRVKHLEGLIEIQKTASEQDAKQRDDKSLAEFEERLRKQLQAENEATVSKLRSEIQARENENSELKKQLQQRRQSQQTLPGIAAIQANVTQKSQQNTAQEEEASKKRKRHEIPAAGSLPQPSYKRPRSNSVLPQSLTLSATQIPAAQNARPTPSQAPTALSGRVPTPQPHSQRPTPPTRAVTTLQPPAQAPPPPAAPTSSMRLTGQEDFTVFLQKLSDNRRRIGRPQASEAEAREIFEARQRRWEQQQQQQEQEQGGAQPSQQGPAAVRASSVRELQASLAVPPSQTPRPAGDDNGLRGFAAQGLTFDDPILQGIIQGNAVTAPTVAATPAPAPAAPATASTSSLPATAASAPASAPSLIPCLHCHFKWWNETCDAGEPCQNCASFGADCHRALCVDYEAGCPRGKCARVHKADRGRYPQAIQKPKTLKREGTRAERTKGPVERAKRMGMAS
ncbi:glucose repression mediator protein [Curvularia kusanoi]|uniref:Glucose repression mediator protein n=1 Tax=Curvularia kusanoi TaxID=90978 RepID=A0A9P4WAY2_CURKU|nr:glucose repression mediator protein [Curvularia kusanoi]